MLILLNNRERKIAKFRRIKQRISSGKKSHDFCQTIAKSKSRTPSNDREKESRNSSENCGKNREFREKKKR